MFLRVLLILMCMLIAFVLAMFIGSLSAPKTGFEGSAHVLGYGVAGLAIGLIVGVIVTRIINPSRLKTVVIYAGIISLVLVGWIIYQMRN